MHFHETSQWTLNLNFPFLHFCIINCIHFNLKNKCYLLINKMKTERQGLQADVLQAKG